MITYDTTQAHYIGYWIRTWGYQGGGPGKHACSESATQASVAEEAYEGESWKHMHSCRVLKQKENWCLKTKQWKDTNNRSMLQVSEARRGSEACTH